MTKYPFGNTFEGADKGNNYRFTGQEADDELGLQYFHARWYDGEVGRFCQTDPINGNPQDIQALNPYTYVKNNPVNSTDKDGKMVEEAVAVALVCPECAVVIAVALAVVDVALIYNLVEGSGGDATSDGEKVNHAEESKKTEGEKAQDQAPTADAEGDNPTAKAKPVEGEGVKEGDAAKDQLDSIGKAQSRNRDKGLPDKIRDITKSRQRERNINRRITEPSDVDRYYD